MTCEVAALTGRSPMPLTKVVPRQLIEYAFGDRMAVVEFADGAQGVTVTVTFDGETTHSEEQQRTGWQAILDNFTTRARSVLSTYPRHGVMRGSHRLTFAR
jgi:hypothetical protein